MDTPTTQDERKKKQGFFSGVPLHPFLFAVHPILFLVVYNKIGFWANASIPTALTLGVVAIELLLCGLVLRNFRKGAVLVSIWTIVFFWSMPFLGMIHETGLVHLGSDFKYLFLLLFPLSAWLVWRTKSTLDFLHLPLNAISLTLVFFVFLSGIVPTSGAGASQKIEKPSQEQFALSSSETDSAALPDIYVIVVDGFGGKECLDKVYGYDDEPFYSFLEQQGFQVARNSFSNYSRTIHSMSSIMNMDYHDKVLSEETMKKHGTPLERDVETKIHDSVVSDFLREKGYRRIIVTEAANEMEQLRPDTEKTFNFEKSPEFLVILWRSTLLTTFNDNFVDRDAYRRQTLAIFSALKQTSTLTEIAPKYVHAHVICPHSPFVFKEDGTLPEFYNEKFLSEKEEADLYLQQHIFTEKQLRDIIPTLIGNSKTDPVIVLLSDHSTRWLRGFTGITDFQREPVLDTYQNLVAIRLPGQGHTPLPAHFHNVNLFRYVLNELFDTDYKMLTPRFFKFAMGRVYETTEEVLPIYQSTP